MANLLAEDTEMIFEVQFCNFFCSLIEMETVHTGNQILRLSGRSVYTTWSKNFPLSQISFIYGKNIWQEDLALTAQYNWYDTLL